VQLAPAQAQPAVVPVVPSTLAEAFALYQRGKFASAAEKYRLILATDDKNSDAYAGLVETLLKQKDIEQARVIIDKALKNADSPKVRVAFGEVEYREGSVSNAEREWLNVAKTLEMSPGRTAWRVILPAAAPTILTGMRISVGIAWLVIVAAEMLVGGTGIGYFVWNEWNNLSITNVITAILFIGVVGMALDQLMARLQRLVSYAD